MRKGLACMLAVLIVLSVAGPAWAQGNGAGTGQPAAGGQQGPGGSPTDIQGPFGTQVQDREQTRTQELEQADDSTQTRQRETVRTEGAVDEPLMTRQQVRLQICDETCAQEPVGLMTMVRAWLRSRAPAAVQQRLLGVVPFSMSGTAVIETDNTLSFTMDSGNRWTEELMAADPAPQLLTADAVIKVVYPDGSAPAETIEWSELDGYP